MTAIVGGRVAYRPGPIWRETMAETSQDFELGIISVQPEVIVWRPETASGQEKLIPVGRVVTVELGSTEFNVQPPDQPYVVLHTPDQMHVFVCGDYSDISSSELTAAIRQRITEQFSSGDELTYGVRPRRFRNVPGPHVVLAVSDLSWGDSVSDRFLKVELSTVCAPFSWKRRVVLPEDVYNHLQARFSDLIDQAAQGGGIAELCRDLGALLLHNTVSARAVAELSRLSPSLVTLRIDELLAHFPWGIIHDGAKYVLLDYASAQQISTIGSVEIYTKPATEDRRRLLILSNPTLDLPGAQREAKDIVASFEDMKLDAAWDTVHTTGNEVTRVAVMTALASGRYEVVHYAGHAQFDQADPTTSAWILHDGRLSVVEIQQNVEGNPPSLVYASACEAGREETWASLSYQRQLFGLASAFLSGGVRNYIGGFWPIPDTDAARLAGDFYRAFLGGAPIAEAMRKAKHRLATNGGDPLVWGGMTLFGDPSTRLLPPK